MAQYIWAIYPLRAALVDFISSEIMLCRLLAVGWRDARDAASTGSSTVRELFLDDERDGQLLIEGFGSRLEHAVIIVSPVTKGTYQSARYTLVVEDATP